MRKVPLAGVLLVLMLWLAVVAGEARALTDADEIKRLIGLAGQSQPSGLPCEAADTNHDGFITVEEVVAAELGRRRRETKGESE